jgi:hypothetical protein
VLDIHSGGLSVLHKRPVGLDIAEQANGGGNASDTV